MLSCRSEGRDSPNLEPEQRSCLPAGGSARRRSRQSLDTGQRSVWPTAKHPFAAQIASLSEPGGYFDTDNLISNERSYLEVLPELERRASRRCILEWVRSELSWTSPTSGHPSRSSSTSAVTIFCCTSSSKRIIQQARTRVEYLALLFRDGRYPLT